MAVLSRNAVIVIILMALLIIGIQIWGNIEIARHTDEILNQINNLPQEQLTDVKTRQEVIAIRVENETKALFWTGLVGSLGTLLAVFAALIGLWQGLRDYWANREKERLDRASTELNNLWAGIANSDSRVRAGAIVGLQHYLTPDKGEYHSRVLSALMVTARLEKDPEVQRIIIETIRQGLLHATSETGRQISWQRAYLKGINLQGLDLSGFDFRDAILEDAELQHCILNGALLNAANLKGARLNHAKLVNANLEYADLAGARLDEADLTGCNLSNAMILNADFQKTNLTNAIIDTDTINWKMIKNWRSATIEKTVMDTLVMEFGPVANEPKILMLLWEYPPLAVGGAWTAAYHIIRQLRKQGADLTVVVPWNKTLVDFTIFGNDIELIPMDIDLPKGLSSYGSYPASSVYGKPFSVYGRISSYNHPYSAYAGKTSVYYRNALQVKEGPIGGMVDEFQKRVTRFIRKNKTKFDIIYASDWPTFRAGEEISRATSRPWVAHFHSTEADRRPGDPDGEISAIERRGAGSASRIVTPSRFTADQVSEQYDIPRENITVISNPLSRDVIPVSECGSFDTHKVVFIGRLTGQKGPDLFIRTCDKIKKACPESSFEIYGSGEEKQNLWDLLNSLRIDIPCYDFVEWESRGRSFGNASVVLVPSRAEPFGMVILEAMERGVPVFYPIKAGASEVLASGKKINPEKIEENAREIVKLLRDKKEWERIEKEQTEEIKSYYDRDYAILLLRLFKEISMKKPLSDT